MHGRVCVGWLVYMYAIHGYLIMCMLNIHCILVGRNFKGGGGAGGPCPMWATHLHPPSIRHGRVMLVICCHNAKGNAHNTRI